MPNNYEKGPLSSKKFIAYLVSELSWKLIILVALLVFKDQLSEANFWAWWFMLVTVLVAGFGSALYIGGQAALDKYVRVATLMTKVPGHGAPEPPEES